ncbi:MAG: hypothetical protein NT099_03560 [Candidatus Saganbacteria bacterium]|nr:hypothetical protein [Candidatus Saganbacteria bacterium]
MIKVPGEGIKPYVPPPITPKEAKGGQPVEEEQYSKPTQPMPKEAQIGRGPEMDSRAIAVRMAAAVTEAKKKDIDKEMKFEEIVRKVIEQTGMQEAEAAMAEASKQLQKDIETTLDEIKSNRDLMEEAEAWQDFAELLSSKLSQEQLEDFFGVLKEEIKNL